MTCFYVGTFIALVGVFVSTTIGLWLYNRAIKKREEIFKERKLKYVPIPNLFWLILTGQRLENVELEKIKQNGTVFGTSIFMKPAFLVAEPELLQIILTKEFTNFTDRREFAFAQDELANCFLTVLQGEKWKRVRSVITPTFATGKLRQMQPRVNLALETLVENIQSAIDANGGQNIDMKRQFGAFTMNTIIQISYGIRVDSLNDSHPIIVHAKQAFNGLGIKNLAIFFIMLTSPKLAKLLKLRFNAKVVDYFKDFSSDIIQRRKQDLRDLKENGQKFKPNNFLDFMIEAEEELERAGSEDEHSHKYISLIEMISQCVLFFLAGYETTAGALTLTIYHLMLHPELQERVHDEIVEQIEMLKQNKSINEDSAQSNKILDIVTLDDLPRFKLLGAVFDETLRLYPPAAFIERTAVNDCRVQSSDGKFDIHFRKGDLVHIPVHAIHRDERNFKDSGKFDPERFIDGRENEHHRYAYLPFGAGPRNCVAKTFALMEAKMALIQCVYNFKFSVSSKTNIPPKLLNQGGMISPINMFASIERR